MIFLISSCNTTTKWQPKIYGHDYVQREIVEPGTLRRISTGDKEFNHYVSFSLDNLKKLAILLKNAKVPAHIRVLLEAFDDKMNKIKSNQVGSKDKPRD